MKQCLFHLNLRALQQQRTRTFVIRKQRIIKSAIFGVIKQQYIENFKRRDALRAWRSKRCRFYYAKVLEGLKFVVKNGSKMMLQKHERIRLRYVFTRWTKLHQRRMSNLNTGSSVQQRTRANLLKTSLKKWRTELFLKQADVLKAEPFFKDVICQRRLEQVFGALKDYYSYKLEKRLQK
jgi:hypothetical protein